MFDVSDTQWLRLLVKGGHPFVASKHGLCLLLSEQYRAMTVVYKSDFLTIVGEIPHLVEIPTLMIINAVFGGYQGTAQYTTSLSCPLPWVITC